MFFVLIPVVWLGVLGPGPLEGNLAAALGPTFAPVFGGLAKAAAVGFVAFNMFCGTLQPLSGASRTLSQLSEDGLLPRTIGYRHPRTDAPVVAILATAVASLAFLLLGDPISLMAAANLTYLIGIALPSVAVWLLRRNEPDRVRTYRAHDPSIVLGVVAAAVWLVATVLGFEQFGLPIVIFGLALAFSGSLAYAWRAHGDRRRAGARAVKRSIYVKLTGAMLLVLALDGVGYLIAVDHVAPGNDALVAMLKDIFVVVGLLTISVGLVLPGMIAHTANQVQVAAQYLAEGTLADLTAAMEAMAGDDLDRAHAPVTAHPGGGAHDRRVRRDGRQLQPDAGRGGPGRPRPRRGRGRAAQPPRRAGAPGRGAHRGPHRRPRRDRAGPPPAPGHARPHADPVVPPGSHRPGGRRPGLDPRRDRLDRRPGARRRRRGHLHRRRPRPLRGPTRSSGTPAAWPASTTAR